ncbi:hypothetical protein KL86PLE_41361 [uncultured Pleomorphomonas sp.]|uniref:Uncharacterized protein n=1 Tax=uncultured Pleomorphomonas sp. TaxID=442121 RepID=A0A212LJ18_9HYPH|nr:hypothetical protein KL86PLE_41361 [uncultured Pleomorphomonas sp.]
MIWNRLMEKLFRVSAQISRPRQALRQKHFQLVQHFSTLTKFERKPAFCMGGTMTVRLWTKRLDSQRS